MKRFALLLYMIICTFTVLLCAYAWSMSDVFRMQDEAFSASLQITAEEIQPDTGSYELLLLQFFEDARVPEAARQRFAEAVRGNGASQKWISEYEKKHDGLDWSVKNAIFPFRNSDHPYTEKDCLFNIGVFYYQGKEQIGFSQDLARAFEWFKRSADYGNSHGAVWAGDMARYGDGTPVDEKAAFSLYTKAVNVEPNGAALKQLGDCYATGIGTAIDRGLAFKNYLDSALVGYAPGLYELTAFAGDAEMDLHLLYKAASSRNYSGGYWEMVYGGLDEYAVDDAKRDLVGKLFNIWDSGADPVAINLKASLRSNEYFPREFVEALLKTSYTYSYFAFADEFGIRPNRNFEDVKNIQFAPYDTSDYENGYWVSVAERYLRYEGCKFYEFDFDGDGVDEIGIPVHSGAGGAHAGDGFKIYKKTDNGLEFFSSGPGCTLRDAMRIVRHSGRIYFIVNWFDDTANTPHDIMAYTVDENGQGHILQLNCIDYDLRRIITYTDEAYAAGYDAFFAEVENQMRDAVSAAKQQHLYSPKSEQQLPYHYEDNYWRNPITGYSDEVARQNTFLVADIDNSGTEKVIHKSRLITHSKYYNDFNWFQIYDNRDDFDTGTASIKEQVHSDEHYGLHSGGNLYNLLPVGDNVVQFWTYEHEGVTYSLTLQRYKLLYTLQIFMVHSGEASLVSKSLYFDEAQGVEITFL